MRISDYFVRTASAYPSRVALRDMGAQYTYEEALAFIDGVAHALRARFVKGAHVAIYSPNDCRVTLLQLAVNRADLTWISLHPGNSGAANARILERFGCDLVFYNPAFARETGELRSVLPTSLFVAMDECGVDDPTIADLVGPGAGPFEPSVPEDPNAIAILQPTGGTTGPSKGVLIPHRALEASALGHIHADPSLTNGQMLVVAPLTHAAGVLALNCLVAGGTIHVLPGFDVGAFIAAVERHRITSVFLPPTALYRVMDDPRAREADLSSLRTIMVGAAPMAPKRARDAIALFGPVLAEGYGQSEALAPLTYKTPSDYIRPNGEIDEQALCSIGRPVFNAHIEIMDDEGRLLGPGAVGEIVVRSNAVMMGYFGDPELTEKVSRFGWHHTEDVGFRDERGFITLVDRKKDMIISGGFNIYPAQLEAVINAHPGVRDCIVVGVPDEDWGEAVKAVVEPIPGFTIDEQEIIERCRAELGRIYAPKSVEFWDELPRSTVGKLLRRTVREKFWKDQARQI